MSSLKLNSVTIGIEKPFLSEWLFFYLLHMKKEDHSVFITFLNVGLLIGLIVGLLADNIGLWLPLGVAFGAALGYQKLEEK